MRFYIKINTPALSSASISSLSLHILWNRDHPGFFWYSKVFFGCQFFLLVIHWSWCTTWYWYMSFSFSDLVFLFWVRMCLTSFIHIPPVLWFLLPLFLSLRVLHQRKPLMLCQCRCLTILSCIGMGFCCVQVWHRCLSRFFCMQHVYQFDLFVICLEGLLGTELLRKCHQNICTIAAFKYIHYFNFNVLQF